MIELPTICGVGLGYRSPHHDDLLGDESASRPPWLEVLADNFLFGGVPLAKLKQICERYPVVLHCVGSNIAGVDGPDADYLKRVKKLFREIGAQWISDHLCWTRHGNVNHYDLLPLLYNKELLELCSENIKKIQDVMGKALVVENVSAYHGFTQSEMTEAEFLKELNSKTGCELLLDVNNIIVNENNLGIDRYEFLESVKDIPVRQMHVAGHRKDAVLWIDDHGSSVDNDTLGLLKHALDIFPNSPVLLEWDNNVPDYATLKTEIVRIGQAV